jgi:hypothetical protein
MPRDGGLRASLQALTTGDFAAWRPLPADASATQLRRDAPDASAGPGGEWLLGQPATSWRLPPTPAAPFGVVVWLQHDIVTLVEVRDPAPSADPEAALGPPEAILPSGLGPAQEQRFWPSRGLVLHVDTVTGRITRLFGHERATVEQMTNSPLAAIRIEKRPIRVSED